MVTLIFLTFSCMEFEQWSDAQLLSTCVRYGEEARKWKNKFLGLLPEVERRKLYEQKGFPSIFYFAKVIGGVSEEQVRTVLRVEASLKDKPVLHALLVNGEVSINKMVKVHTVATAQNQEALADQVQLLSNRAVETLAKDIRIHTSSSTSFMHVQEYSSENNLKLEQDVEQRLADLQNKGININAFLREALEKREKEIEKEKAVLAKQCEETTSRYIPKATRDLLLKEYGTKCSIASCTKPMEEIHHTQRFSLSRKHDPRYMAPLCHEHHQIAHAIDQKVQIKKQQNKNPKYSSDGS